MSSLGSTVKTYQIDRNAPPPMPWTEYSTRVVGEWGHLLSSNPTEAAVHSFLEQHPSLVPGAYGMGAPSGHGPFPYALLSKPPLQGFGARVPDFMWIAMDSETLRPVLVEIEAPDKKWFTKKETPTELTQARTQLAQWRAWLDDPPNRLLFINYYDIPERSWKYLAFRPAYVLIYGRRCEFEERPHLTKIRAGLHADDEYFMTFDRLASAQSFSDYLTIRKTSTEYEAISFPACASLSPTNARWWWRIKGKAEIAQKNSWISESRRSFLMGRIPYWDRWGREHENARVIINLGDEE